jgi:LmbE family N-acetylglucosaminyl deacetylase
MNVLFISVHPDDETLGCGGTILKHREQGDSVYWLIITAAVEALGYSIDFIKKREQQIEFVSQAYRFSETYKLGFPTTKLHTVDLSDLITAIASVIRNIEPRVVYTVNRSDIHTDHQVVARAVMSSTKSFRYPFIKRVLMYECLSETEVMPPLPEHIFIPNVYSDISNFMDKKIEIMKIYESELQESPLPRSVEAIKALAQFRGASVAVKYAEAFMLLRDLF